MSIRIGDKIIAANYATQIVSNATTEKAGIIKIATDEEISAGQRCGRIKCIPFPNKIS